MAGRQARNVLKLQGDPFQREPSAISSEDESDSGEEDQKPFNPFSLLEDEEDASKAESSTSSDSDTPTPPPQQQKPSTTKPKPPPPTQQQNQEEDIDSILKELNITSTSSPSFIPPPPPSSSPSKALLSLDIKSLRADAELKRHFGSQITDLEDDDDEAGASAFAGASRRIRRLAARGLITTRPKHPLKPGKIIQPKSHWPPLPDDERIQLISASRIDLVNSTTNINNNSYKSAYKVVHSAQYKAIQGAYEECQASFDPNHIAALLQRHPYHLDALLTMHDLYRSMGENAAADEMLERCVYAIEMSWQHVFNSLVQPGLLYLEYDIMSAPIFIGLFKWVQSLSRRGLHKTGLEVGKLLLGLNDEDPMGVLFCIDYLAVRSRQYEFLEQFVKSYDSSTALMPNMMFSVALAAWYREQEQGNNGSSKDGGSGELLLKAVAVHPLGAVKLIDKVCENTSGLDSLKGLKGLPILASDGGGSHSHSLSHLYDIMVERQHGLWKSTAVLNWFQHTLQSSDGDNGMVGGLSLSDWEAVRSQAFPAENEGSENVYGHLRVADYGDTVQRLPVEEMHGMMHGDGNGGGGDGNGGGAVMGRRVVEIGEEELRDGNPLWMLLQTMLPWVQAGQQPEYTAGGDGERRDGDDEGDGNDD